MIHFYSMDACGYCAKAKQVLAPEIASGFVVVKDAKEAKNATGFPHFVETTTGATHTGFMADKQKLFEKLGVKQNKEAYHHQQAHHQHHHQQAHQQAQSKEGFENCSSVNGGYLSLNKTWSTQKRYVA